MEKLNKELGSARGPRLARSRLARPAIIPKSQSCGPCCDQKDRAENLIDGLPPRSAPDAECAQD